MDKTEITLFVIIANIVFLIFIIAAAVFILQYRKRKLMYIKETEKAEAAHAQELLATQFEMQQQTMLHIGREIHDNVGQKLTLASLYAQQLAYENKAPQINNSIKNIGDIINDSLAELRQLSKSLTDNSIDTNSIYDLLQSECNKVNNTGRVEVSFTAKKKNIIISYQEKNILLRVAQEFLQNSIKHAECKHISITMDAQDELLLLELKDDGKGFDTEAVHSNGIGLTNMKERIATLKGTFQLSSKPQQGTLLLITLPLKNKK